MHVVPVGEGRALGKRKIGSYSHEKARAVDMPNLETSRGFLLAAITFFSVTFLENEREPCRAAVPLKH